MTVSPILARHSIPYAILTSALLPSHRPNSLSSRMDTLASSSISRISPCYYRYHHSPRPSSAPSLRLQPGFPSLHGASLLYLSLDTYLKLSKFLQLDVVIPDIMKCLFDATIDDLFLMLKQGRRHDPTEGRARTAVGD